MCPAACFNQTQIRPMAYPHLFNLLILVESRDGSQFITWLTIGRLPINSSIYAFQQTRAYNSTMWTNSTNGRKIYRLTNEYFWQWRSGMSGSFFGIKTGPTCKLRPMYVLYKGFKDQKSSGQTEQLWLLDKILYIVERF